VITLTIDEYAHQFAWQLGYDDYPAIDCCIYSSGKNPILYEAYWSGWNKAAAMQWGIYAPRRETPSNPNRFSKYRAKSAA
jgi:hypothetical protein